MVNETDDPSPYLSARTPYQFEDIVRTAQRQSQDQFDFSSPDLSEDDLLANSMYHLGNVARGRNDKESAVRWYVKAAEDGHIGAALMLIDLDYSS